MCFKRACRWKLYVLCNCKWTEHPWYYSVRLRHHAPSTLWSQSFIFVRFTCNFRRLVTSDLLNSRTNCCRLCFEITSRWLHTYHLWIQLKPPKVYETSSSMQTPFTLQSYCVTHCTFTRDFRSYCKATKLPFFWGRNLSWSMRWRSPKTVHTMFAGWLPGEGPRLRWGSRYVHNIRRRCIKQQGKASDEKEKAAPVVTTKGRYVKAIQNEVVMSLCNFLTGRLGVSEWVSSFLTAHQHIKGYFVPSRLLCM